MVGELAFVNPIKIYLCKEESQIAHGPPLSPDETCFAFARPRNSPFSIGYGASELLTIVMFVFCNWSGFTPDALIPNLL